MAGALACHLATAATADLADQPLATASDGSTVRSNLMFILDDSGSMGDDFLPDSANSGDVCFGSSDYNTIFYNPARTYAPPVNSDGTSKSNATFSAAWNDGFTLSGGTTDLTKNNPNTASLAQQISQSAVVVGPTVCGKKADAACSTTGSSNSTTDASGNTTTIDVKKTRGNALANKTCGTTANSCTLTTTTTTTVTGPSSQFLWATRKAGASASSCNAADFDIVRYTASLTAAQMTNYANWYAYYRKRMLAMRSSAGLAFSKIDATRFRIGFATIHNSSNTDSKSFLNIRNFDTGTQKSDFYSRLYSISPNSSTPLRPALERAGKYYANKLSGQTDPVQYSCQRNYTILSTDGYWNTGDEPSNYVPTQLDGITAIGNPDAGASVARPLRDEVNGTGVSNSLADIAMYFYMTDLRDSSRSNCTGAISGQDVCENNVPSDGVKDTAQYQHMTTFTLGLGANGTLVYNKNYETQTSGDYWDIRQGTKVWPDPKVTSSSNSVTERIDDLWHAAVDGRGHYYSASDSADLADSLVNALSSIEALTGSSAAAATSSLTPSSGDDWLFIPLYTTKTWEGTVNAFKIDTATGAVLTPTTPIWSASSRIATQGARTILFRKSSATNGTAAFNYANLSAVSLNAPFDNLCASGAAKLSQCATLSSAALAKVTGTNVVDYLAGGATYDTNAVALDDRLFRARAQPLGDVVDGAPVYVKKPPFKYADSGYSSYASAQAGRQAVLYVAANDGMLHALKVASDSTGGTELWAYVPTQAMANMGLLADTSYAGKHHYYVDGAPVIADVYSGGAWHTILVGGLGKGGRGYYCLDITDPATPKSLWEFTDTDLGYTYGNPIVTKNKAGTWVVAFSSGYNNVSPGDGQGHLYILDAFSGAQLKKLSTGTGSTTTPSNLGKINAWVDDDSDNTALRIYGSDMLGNVWRFDFDDRLPGAVSGANGFLLASAGSGQPITTKPILTEVVSGATKVAVISVATGRYLGQTDIGDTTTQSVYSFKDDLSTTSLGALRSNSLMVQQTLKSDRSGLLNPLPVSWATQAGWFVDLSLSSGERVNVDFDQQFNELIIASNIPTSTVCASGGVAWLYYLDVGSGKVLLSYSTTSLVAGITDIVSTTGKLVTLVQGVDGKNTAHFGVDPSTIPPGSVRRTSWRELVE
jgi:type IV pilus assembly protein PilY1